MEGEVTTKSKLYSGG